MNRLIKKLVDEHGYPSYCVQDFKTKDIEQQSLKNVMFISNNGCDYFVFIELSIEQFNYNSIHEMQKQLHIYSKKNIAPSDDFELTEYYERNRTLVLSVRLNNDLITKDNLRLIADIEEDPYLFKKQIIALTEAEYRGVNELLNKDSNEVLTICENIVTDYNLFENFKAEQGGEIQKSCLYSLVATLYEKLPFMKYPIQEESKQNLQAQIDKKLCEEKLYDLTTSLLDINSDDYADWFDAKFAEYKVNNETN